MLCYIESDEVLYLQLLKVAGIELCDSTSLSRCKNLSYWLFFPNSLSKIKLEPFRFSGILI